jgi:hypothetical protein
VNEKDKEFWIEERVPEAALKAKVSRIIRDALSAKAHEMGGSEEVKKAVNYRDCAKTVSFDKSLVTYRPFWADDEHPYDCSDEAPAEEEGKPCCENPQVKTIIILDKPCQVCSNCKKEIV